MLLLYIDDDSDDIDIFQDVLKEIGQSITCITARDGIQGLTVLESNIPEYIFLDINMPVMNGVEVLRRVRTQARLKDVPVIMVSTTIYNMDELLKEGATACIVKPATFQEYCFTLKTLLA
jgi:CheY-like chemotaxis protein